MEQLAESRRRREERTCRIRKVKKEGYHHKRRGITPCTEHRETLSFVTVPQISDISLVIMSMKECPCDKIVTLNLHFIQELLRMDTSTSIEAIVDNGCLSFFASLLKRDDSCHFQHTATWILTEISSGGFSRHVVDTKGVLQDLVTLLQSPHAPICNQAGHCLGVLANDRIQFRDKLLEIGVVEHLLHNIHSSGGDDAILTAMTFALSSMCHGLPQPQLDLLTTVIYFAVSLILDQSCSNDVIKHALQCLAGISGGSVEGSNAVSAIGAYALIQRLVHIISQLGYCEQSDPALRTLSNICDHPQAFDPVQAAVNTGILDFAQDFLATGASTASSLDVVKIINKVASGSATITQLMTRESIVSNLVCIAMEGNSEWRVRKEAIQAVCHMALATNDCVVQGLVKHNGVEALVESLYLRIDDGVLLNALTAVERLFQVGERLEEPYGLMIDQWHGIDRIEVLQNHANVEIAALAECIMEQYVVGSDVEDGNCSV